MKCGNLPKWVKILHQPCLTNGGKYHAWFEIIWVDPCIYRGNSTYVLFDESSIHVGKVILFQIRSLDDPCKNVDGHREDDGAVVLRRDAAQGLQVAQLGSIHKIKI